MDESGSGTFCVVCGKQGVELFDALCASCLGETKALVTIPQRIEVTLCSLCGARHVGKHWERGPPPGLFRSADLDVHVKVFPPAKLLAMTWEEGSDARPLGHGVRAFTGTATLKVGSTEPTVRLLAELREIHHTCPRCSRKEGSFYTANIQFRPALHSPLKRSLDDFKNSTHRIWEEFIAEAPRSWREAVAWEEELKEGWDVYLMETSVAKTMAKALRKLTGSTTKESATLWGIREGRRAYRVTILLRFPPVMNGDFFERQGELVRVIGQDEENIRVQDSSGRVPRILSEKDLLQAYRFVGGSDRFVTTSVESLIPLRVVNPETGEPLRVEGLVPPNLKVGSEAKVLLDGERAWWVPELLLKRRSR